MRDRRYAQRGWNAFMFQTRSITFTRRQCASWSQQTPLRPCCVHMYMLYLLSSHIEYKQTNTSYTGTHITTLINCSHVSLTNQTPMQARADTVYAVYVVPMYSSKQQTLD